MTPTETATRTFAESVSTFTFFAWVLTICPGGFLLLSGIAYAMVTENLALGLVCGLLLFVPYILGFAWFLGWGASLAVPHVVGKVKELAHRPDENRGRWWSKNAVPIPSEKAWVSQ